MSSAALESHLTTIACPLCGGRDFAVVRKADYPDHMSVDEFAKAFQASSDHRLMDQLVECRSCSLVYVNPRVDESILLAGYQDAVDPEFVSKNQDRIRTFERTLRPILKTLNIPSNKRILDVGCAGGAFLVAAKNCGLQPIGIEPSRWMADYGRSQYGVEIHQGILEAGRFPTASFDMVSMWDVIEHVTKPAEVLKTISDVLVPEGILLINYPDYGSWAARLMGGKWPFLLSVHLLYYTRATMVEQLRRAGFQTLQIRPHFQTLPFGYLLQRATPYLSIAGLARRGAEACGIAGMPLTYNMGQTLVVARKVAATA